MTTTTTLRPTSELLAAVKTVPRQNRAAAVRFADELVRARTSVKPEVDETARRVFEVACAEAADAVLLRWGPRWARR